MLGEKEGEAAGVGGDGGTKRERREECFVPVVLAHVRVRLACGANSCMARRPGIGRNRGVRRGDAAVWLCAALCDRGADRAAMAAFHGPAHSSSMVTAAPISLPKRVIRQASKTKNSWIWQSVEKRLSDDSCTPKQKAATVKT